MNSRLPKSKRHPTVLHPLRGVKRKRMPSVLHPNKCVRLTREEWAEVRQLLCYRACGRCEECKTPVDLESGQAHHVKFRSRGGKHELENLQWLCFPCHRSKHGVPQWSKPA